MAAPSNYPSGFPSGIAIRGVSILQTHPGKVFYVDNSVPGNGDLFVNGSNGNKGTFKDPYATIAYAVTQARANKGDIIIVKAGHAETISAAAGLVLSTAGIAIIGLGVGSNRPTITLGTANTASITVTANNVSVQNILFVANFLNIATVFSIANAQVATDFTVDRCEFRDGSTILNFVAAVTVGTTANIADGLTFTNNKVLGLASSPAAATTAVVVASDTKRMTLSGNFINHEVALTDTACLLAGGALNHTQLVVDGNEVFRPSTSTTGHLITSSSTACSGIVSNNLVAHLDATGGLMIPTGTKLAFFRNFCMITGAADKSALENPAAV